MEKIHIFNATKYKKLPRKPIMEVLNKVMKYFGKDDYSLFVVYTTRNEILRLNREFLSHNYVTDVITFDLSEGDKLIAEIYICVSQAKKQANQFSVSLKEEITRLTVHGVLHLLGFDDSTLENREKMHKFENNFIG